MSEQGGASPPSVRYCRWGRWRRCSLQCVR